MRLSPPRRKKRSPLRFILDPLEPRALLAAVSPSFATFRGRINGGTSEAIIARLDTNHFGLAAGGRVILKLEASAAGDGRLDPGPTTVTSSVLGGVRIVSRRANIAGASGSVTVASVRPGTLTIVPQAQDRTEGDFKLDVSLAGDADANFRVDRRDIQAIIGAIRGTAVAPGADVNGDGRVGMLDLRIAVRNLGATTDIRPLSVSARVDPASDPDGDGHVDLPSVDVVGLTSPGATVRLDRGADGSFEATATAGADGRYRFSVPLQVGANPVAIEANGLFGQHAEARTTIIRGSAATPISATFDFSEGAQSWQSGFADLPVVPNASYELEAGIRPLPQDLGVSGTGYLLQSHNRSDDVFMFLKRRLTEADGVRPNQEYELHYTITFASNAPSAGIGAGGAPGEAVQLKAGGSTVEPLAVPKDDGLLRMNVDIGGNGDSGSAASIVSNIANGQEGITVPYVSLTREHTHSFPVPADSAGNIWLLVGTDSGFEGLTALYYQRIVVELIPVSG